MWTTASIEALEASSRQWQRHCQELERQAKALLADLKKCCDEAENTQNGNNKALQDLHRELGELAGAANQQTLTALLIEPSGADNQAPKSRKKNGVRRVSQSSALTRPDTPTNDVRSTIERARARGNRFNIARIREWVIEVEKALPAGIYAVMNRALAGLAAELAK